MTDHWIITDRKYHKHDSVEAAEAECERLQEITKGKSFRIFRIKSSIHAGKSRAITRQLAEALQGVVRVADRKTDEFDAAHAALAEWEQHK